MTIKRCPYCANCVCTVAPRRKRRRKAERRGVISVRPRTKRWLQSEADAVGASLHAMTDALVSRWLDEAGAP